jgi:hypothetical protein
LFVFSLFISHKPLYSIPPVNVKDTLSTSQLSYFARLSSGTTAAGDSVLKVALSANPSNNTNNLFIGDTIGIGTTGAGVGISGPLTIYTVKDIANTGTFEINSGIGQSNAFVNAAIIATRSAVHTISFTPKSNTTGGAWQVLIKASGRGGETYNDGIPDQYGFDLGATSAPGGSTGLGTRLQAADIACPWSATASVGTTIWLTSNIDTGSTGPYHIITCQLSAGATSAVDIGVTITIGRPLASGSQLINPSAGLTAIQGRADSSNNVFSFLIRHLDSVANGSGVIDADTAKGKVAVIESVRVTATVDPTLTFYIDSIGVSGVGTTACGNTLKSDAVTSTTATAVYYGALSLGAFNDLAQRLSCVTNASSGYVVTVYQADQMRNIGDTTVGGVGITIADTICDGGCTYTTTAAWTTNTTSQWGYGIQNINVGNSVTDFVTGYRAFGVGAAQATSIMSKTSTPNSTETANICYRLTASTTQAAGNYENHLVFTATATF